MPAKRPPKPRSGPRRQLDAIPWTFAPAFFDNGVQKAMALVQRSYPERFLETEATIGGVVAWKAFEFSNDFFAPLSDFPGLGLACGMPIDPDYFSRKQLKDWRAEAWKSIGDLVETHLETLKVIESVRTFYAVPAKDWPIGYKIAWCANTFDPDLWSGNGPIPLAGARKCLLKLVERFGESQRTADWFRAQMSAERRRRDKKALKWRRVFAALERISTVGAWAVRKDSDS